MMEADTIAAIATSVGHAGIGIVRVSGPASCEIARAVFRNSRQQKITVFFLSLVLLVTIFGSVVYVVEGPENGFTSIPISIYWAVVTVRPRAMVICHQKHQSAKQLHRW